MANRKRNRAVDYFTEIDLDVIKEVEDEDNLSNSVEESKADQMRLSIQQQFNVIPVDIRSFSGIVASREEFIRDEILNTQQIDQEQFAKQLQLINDCRVYTLSDHTSRQTSASSARKDAKTSEDPLYKLIKAKDRVLARYKADQRFYPARVKSVVHRGYTSAAYDIVFEEYDNVETVSWEDIERILPEAETEIKESISSRIPLPPPIPNIKNLHLILVQKQTESNSLAKDKADAVEYISSYVGNENTGSSISTAVVSPPVIPVVVNPKILQRTKGAWKSKK